MHAVYAMHALLGRRTSTPALPREHQPEFDLPRRADRDDGALRRLEPVVGEADADGAGDLEGSAVDGGLERDAHVAGAAGQGEVSRGREAADPSGQAGEGDRAGEPEAGVRVARELRALAEQDGVALGTVASQ